MDGGAFLLLLIAIVLGLAKWGQVHQAKKNKKTLLTASGDTERLEIKEDGSTQLVDGTLTVPKAITMMRRTKAELIKQGTIHHGVELSGKKHEVEILKAVIAVENELTKKSGEGGEALLHKWPEGIHLVNPA